MRVIFICYSPNCQEIRCVKQSKGVFISCVVQSEINMSVTHHQLRTARALLDLSQQDVSDGTGISANALGRIERGEATPKDKTLDRLVGFYQGGGVEFTDRDGVRRNQQLVWQLQGRDGFRTWMNMLYDFAANEGGKITLLNGPPARFLEWLGEDWYTAHAERMRGLEGNIDFKIITEEGEKNFLASGFAEYRWLPKTQFNDRSVYVFGDHSAFFDFNEEELRIVVITQRLIAQTQQMAFDALWDSAIIPE